MAEYQVPMYGTRWIHKKSGHSYTITNIVAREADCYPLVCYYGGNLECIWARPLAEFMEKFESGPHTTFPMKFPDPRP